MHHDGLPVDDGPASGTSRRRRSITALVTGALAVAAVLPAGACAATLNATPATLPSVFASAQPGDAIVLAAGGYGTFNGAMKAGEVTLRAQAGASVTMALDFDPAANITIDGVRLTDVEIGDSRTKNITVRNSDIPGQTTFRTGELQNANILFDHNVHRDWNKCSSCGEGRIWLPENTSQPSGITIQNSEFKGGLSDGIQNGSNGTRILDNTFHDLVEGTPDGVHTDAIQLYGSKNTLIKGNYFVAVPDAIMAPDGADHETIEDNVVAADSNGYPFAVTLWSDNGSTVRHNTFADGACSFNLRCGIISMGAKSGQPAGRGTIVKDNILGEISIGSGQATLAEVTGNLYRSLGGGLGNLTGTPIYTGGSRPTTYAGYILAPGSPGTANASDGLNRGIRTGATPPAPATPPPPPAPTPPPGPAPPPPPVPGGTPNDDTGAIVDGDVPQAAARVTSSLRTIGRNGTLRVEIAFDAPATANVSASIRPGPPVSAKGERGSSRELIKVPAVALNYAVAGTQVLKATLGTEARRTLGRSRSARITLKVVTADAHGGEATQYIRTTIGR
jgi:hypothetical protein